MRKSLRTLAMLVAFSVAVAVMLFFMALPRGHVYGRDLDGHYAQANPQLHAWFNQLASKKGLCCSFADGVKVEDVDWQTTADGQHYQVRLGGQWVDVPEAAVITEPNKFGPAVVWPYRDADGITQIRCFLPGAGA